MSRAAAHLVSICASSPTRGRPCATSAPRRRGAARSASRRTCLPTSRRTRRTARISRGSTSPSADWPRAEPRSARRPSPRRGRRARGGCVRFVAAKYKVPLDFEPETLIARRSVRPRRARGAAREAGGARAPARPRSAPTSASACGARSGRPGSAKGDHDGWRLDFTFVYLDFNPIGMAREALMLGTSGRMACPPRGRRRRAARSSRQRLASLAEIDEEEYYAPDDALRRRRDRRRDAAGEDAGRRQRRRDVPDRTTTASK